MATTRVTIHAGSANYYYETHSSEYPSTCQYSVPKRFSSLIQQFDTTRMFFLIILVALEMDIYTWISLLRWVYLEVLLQLSHALQQRWNWLPEILTWKVISLHEWKRILKDSTGRKQINIDLRKVLTYEIGMITFWQWRSSWDLQSDQESILFSRNESKLIFDINIQTWLRTVYMQWRLKGTTKVICC